ncbi:hypothetical protein A8924_1297 [Saccharopolyspora erythraea NRRL 2338]|uniref:Uncharacterized protein n=2 Tax=Saccharopolyspora erythraea TaxID=1836 RepID=A4F862_SACEN|nr:hypothetical protein [Saccharopolyspora erythraea]EQD84970.1 hypothetical protein N599_17465 [Saccharopolyspora erythraea D]PFG94031.1 hypothetical protein A8924_1297 [Saccharopolyspora erythraea NRRL 2338]QRK90835.1 hypothetical protein JQX30_05025 [Saccharopolyspora erythraea]CAM00237.1 hypothetical protein SACE_0903 [Saccharopolyspora erythraea NRRL 2338]
MARLTATTGTLPLISGLAAATALSGLAIFAVVQSGCDDPGSYRTRDGALELVGGCVQPDDLPVNTRLPTPAPGSLGGTQPALAP